MKAYIVWIDYNDDAGNEIVFAKNTKEALKMARNSELAENADRFIDIRVKRYPVFDDKDNLTHRDFTRLKISEGWRYEGEDINEDSTDEEFYWWYKSYFKK